jgi:hypothetical protein
LTVLASFKPDDPIIASRYVGPPLMDAVVVKTGVKSIKAMGHESEEIPTVTVRFADGKEAEVDARSVPGGPHYAVTTPIGETWCSSAEEIGEAIGVYMNSNEQRRSLAKVSVVLMPPGQKTGVGTPLNPTDFYV